MRTRTALWFECKIRYEKVMEDGLQKKVTELYVVDALTYAEAEARIIEKMSGYISGQFTVEDIKKAAYKEVFFVEQSGKAERFDDGDNCSDRYYRAKLQFITIDEKTEKEKRSNVTYLVNAQSFDGAVKNLKEVMSDTILDYVVAAVSETQVADVFEYGKTDDDENK